MDNEAHFQKKKHTSDDEPICKWCRKPVSSDGEHCGLCDRCYKIYNEDMVYEMQFKYSQQGRNLEMYESHKRRELL